MILQTGDSLNSCMGNAGLSIAALCRAKNLPELETWYKDITSEWKRGTLDNMYAGILRIVKNALIFINGSSSLITS